MNPLEQEEYREAVQEDLNKQNKEFYDTLSQEDKNKFDAISKVLTILTDANVKSYLFSELPMLSPDGIKNTVYQYNNLGDFIKWDKNGKMSLESKISSIYFNHAFIASFFNWARGMFLNPPIQELINRLLSYNLDWYNWNFKNIELPEAKFLKDDDKK